MDFLNVLIIVAVSYLLGSLNSAIMVSKKVLGVDIRSYGSGNAGLTNSYRTMGAKITLLVLFGDILKGVIAVLVGAQLMGPFGKLIAGAFVIVGHVFPIYFGFKGGKGVLVGATMLLLFDWRVFLIAFGIFVLTVIITRWVSLGSILAAISFPISTYCIYKDDISFTVIAVILAAAVIYMHRSNIGRILKGTESRFSFKSKPQIDKK